MLNTDMETQDSLLHTGLQPGEQHAQNTNRLSSHAELGIILPCASDGIPPTYESASLSAGGMHPDGSSPSSSQCIPAKWSQNVEPDFKVGRRACPSTSKELSGKQIIKHDSSAGKHRRVYPRGERHAPQVQGGPFSKFDVHASEQWRVSPHATFVDGLPTVTDPVLFDSRSTAIDGFGEEIQAELRGWHIL